MNQLTTKSVLLFGATGLVGNSLLTQLIADITVLNITVFTRSAYKVNSAKVNSVITDFKDLNSIAHYFKNATVLYCCLGTTIKKAKTKEAFKVVDFEIPVKLAQLASQQGVKKFIALSSLGADANSANFYLSTKGQMERGVAQFHFQKIAFLRPSVLLGKRKEFRLGERIMIAVMKLMSPLLRGKLLKYRPIQAEAVARAMINISNSLNNNTIYESAELVWLGK